MLTDITSRLATTAIVSEQRLMGSGAYANYPDYKLGRSAISRNRPQDVRVGLARYGCHADEGRARPPRQQARSLR